MKKNLIFFCPRIDFGGLEKTLTIYSNFLSKFYNIIILTNCEYKNKLKISKKIKIYNKKNKFFYKFRLLNNIYCVFLYIKYFKNFEKVFSMQDHLFFLFLKIIKKNFKLIIRTSTTIINNKNIYEQKNLKKLKFLKFFTIFFYKFADLTITFSEENKKYIEKRTNNKVLVLYNHFPKKKIIKNKINLENIFFIGRLVEDKDPIFFIRQLIKIRKKFNFKIHLIGKGYLYNEIKNYERKFPKIIKFHGYVKNPFEKFKNKIDLFCVTSRYDGTPNVLGEAMSFGIPCLAPKNVGLSSFMLNNSKFGYLYDPQKKDNFLKKIIQIKKQYKFAKKKAKKGYNSMKRFNKKNTLFKLQDAINSI
jgi:hypothetical protein